MSTFAINYPRPDVREHLRKLCAKDAYKKMSNEDKNSLYQRATKTVNTEGAQISPNPIDKFKDSDWIREIISSWDRVEEDYIPAAQTNIVVLTAEKKSELNAKFEAKEQARTEASELKKQAKIEKSLEKLRAKVAEIDSEVVVNDEGFIVVDGNLLMNLKEFTKHNKEKLKIQKKEQDKEQKLALKTQKLQEKANAKELAKAEKSQEKEAAKQAKAAEKAYAKQSKKIRKAVIRDAVNYMTDSDRRILINDNMEWLTQNEHTGTIDELVVSLKANDYKKLLSDCDGELEKMSWYIQNPTALNIEE